jgi:hypothetical protein
MFLYQNENEFKCTLCGQSKYLKDLCEIEEEKTEYIAENYGNVCKACYDYHFKDFSLEEIESKSDLHNLVKEISEADILGLMFDIFVEDEDEDDLDEDLWGNW